MIDFVLSDAKYCVTWGNKGHRTSKDDRSPGAGECREACPVAGNREAMLQANPCGDGTLALCGAPCLFGTRCEFLDMYAMQFLQRSSKR